MDPLVISVLCGEEVTYASSLVVATFWTYYHRWFSYFPCAAHSPRGFPLCLCLAMVPLLLATMVELPYI